MRILLGLSILLLLGSSLAIFRGTIDAAEAFPAVGMQYVAYNFGAFDQFACEAPVVAFYIGCTGSLLDSDHYLNALGVGSPATRTTFRRRLVLVSAHCMRENDAGFNASLPVDDLLYPSYMGFTYDNWADPARVTYQQVTDILGRTPCTGPRHNASTAVMNGGSSTVFYSYRTLSVGVVNNGKQAPAIYGNDFALLLLDEAVPVALVPDVKLIRVALTPYALPRSRIPSVVTAGFGILGYGNDPDAVTPLGKPDLILGDRLRQYVSLAVNSVQNINLLATMTIASGDQTLCSGDSGAPALMVGDDGYYYTYGVTSRGDTQCRATNIYARFGTPHTSDFTKRVVLAFEAGGFAAANTVRAGNYRAFTRVAVAGGATAPIAGGAAPASTVGPTASASQLSGEAQSNHILLIVTLIAALVVLGAVIAHTVVLCMSDDKHKMY